MRETADRASPTQPSGGLAGYLRLDCRADGAGRSFLARKEYKTPIHISKPYWDGHSLLLNLMCPTAGMLAGDSVDLDCRVSSGAALILSNPSSLRIHRMRPGQSARWDQRFRIESGGFLESNPEWIIPQADSSFQQRTDLQVDDGGTLFFVEALAPGRAAFGEAFAFRQFANRLCLRYGSSLAALEKHVLEPGSDTHRHWAQGPVPKAYSISIFIAAPELEDSSPLWNAAHDLQTDTLRIGSNRLAAGPCWNLKLLAADPSEARSAVSRLRRIFYEALARPAPDLRRS